MNVYRGPLSRDWEDDSHQLVAKITGDELEKGVRDGTLIPFNLTKDGSERNSVGNIDFENKDFIPMMKGMLSRMEKQQARIEHAKSIMKETGISDAAKIAKLKLILDRL